MERSPTRNLVRHAVVLFVVTLVGFSVSAMLGKFLGGDWPGAMRTAIVSASQATTLLVGVVYAVRVGVDG
jgi:hypothetical protein